MWRAVGASGFRFFIIIMNKRVLTIHPNCPNRALFDAFVLAHSSPVNNHLSLHGHTNHPIMIKSWFTSQFATSHEWRPDLYQTHRLLNPNPLKSALTFSRPPLNRVHSSHIIRSSDFLFTYMMSEMRKCQRVCQRRRGLQVSICDLQTNMQLFVGWL